MILVFVVLIPVVGIYRQVILGEPFGNNPMSDTGLFIFLGCALLLLILFMLIRLEIHIDESEINVNFHPFRKKKVLWDEVVKAEVVDYGFVGGWGIRLHTEHGTVYNTGGRRGLAIETKKGERFVIGLNNTQAIQEGLKTWWKGKG